MRPLIAILGRRTPNAKVLRFSGTVMSEAMCEAVWAAGGEPLIMHGPDAAPTADIDVRLARFDGLILPGGSDVDPAWYGQEPASQTEQPVRHDDDFDFGALAAALALDLPILAICRGMQVVNVALGGTLIQELSPSPLEHRRTVHSVAVSGRLRQITGSDLVEVSSYHHQAVDRIGAGLIVTARALDGCIEALEHENGNVIAVQWHPEDLHSTNPADAALFTDLVRRSTQSTLEERHWA